MTLLERIIFYTNIGKSGVDKTYAITDICIVLNDVRCEILITPYICVNFVMISDDYNYCRN